MEKSAYLGVILLSVLMFSCVENTSEEELIVEDAMLVKNSTINSNAVHELLQSIPSPIETTNAIQKSGATFDVNLLNQVSSIDGYQSTYKKSVNLGVYGTDLGYLNLYNKTVTSFEYLDNIRRISDELKIGQFFDFTTLKRLASNKSNMDSIIDISTSGFENMNNYLASQKRENVSTLILVGGWVESVYLLGKIAENSNKSDLKERIGEQKFALAQIVTLLEMYKDNDSYLTLYTKMKALEKTFEKVKITQIYAEPETKEVNGMLVVVDNSRTIVEVPPPLFKQIMTEITDIRKELIK